MIEQYFEYNGIRSDQYNLQIIKLDTGMTSVPMVSAKNIIEDEVSKVASPYFYRTKFSPLTFSLSFTTLDGIIDTEQLYDICGWLFTTSYKPFISSENPSRMLYCMGINQADFVTNGINSQGYFTVEFRCRDPYWLTLPQITNFDLSDNTTYTNIQVTNYSNVNDFYYPEIEFELLDNATGISIYNLNDGNRLFGFSSLSLLEQVYVDNNKKIIISNTTNPRFDKMTTGKLWLRLVRGINNLKVVGKCNLQFRCQFPTFN